MFTAMALLCECCANTKIKAEKAHFQTKISEVMARILTRFRKDYELHPDDEAAETDYEDVWAFLEELDFRCSICCQDEATIKTVVCEYLVGLAKDYAETEGNETKGIKPEPAPTDVSGAEKPPVRLKILDFYTWREKVGQAKCKRKF